LFRRAYGWDAWRNRGNGNIDPATGQSSESGRYQGNATSGILRAVQAAGTVQSQGGDLYEIGGNLILKGVEYAEKYNLGHGMTCRVAQNSPDAKQSLSTARGLNLRYSSRD